METKHIMEFVILAETCSFQETADLTHISQSSLSKHIQKIEEELSVSLFDRSTRSVKLSKYGTAFYEYAKQIVLLCRDYENALHEMRIDYDSSLSVGFQARLGQFGIVEMLSDFSKSHPHLSLKLTESNRPMELLRSRTCDFIIAAEYEPRDEDIRQLLYRVDTLAVILPVEHPLAKESSVTIQQLCDERFVMHEDIPGNTSMETRKFRKLCLDAGFEPNEVMTVSFTSNIVRLVGKGMGIAVINRMHAPSDSSTDDKIVFVDIHPPIPFHTKVLYYKSYKKTPAAEDFLRYVKERTAHS